MHVSHLCIVDKLITAAALLAFSGQSCHKPSNQLLPAFVPPGQRVIRSCTFYCVANINKQFLH